MKTFLRHIFILVVVAMSSLFAHADTPSDSLYIFFYDNWDRMLDDQPVAMIVNPDLVVNSPYEVYFDTGDEQLDDKINEEFIAFSLYDSTWYVNSRYIKKIFDGDLKHIRGFVPLYFNEKTAFVKSPGPMTVKDVLLGTGVDGVTVRSIDYYYMDFKNRRLERVTSDYLSHLLEDYHDLQMRYEGTKDYKKDYVIEDYFFKYIDRYTEDLMTPRIVDLVTDSHQ